MCNVESFRHNKTEMAHERIIFSVGLKYRKTIYVGQVTDEIYGCREANSKKIDHKKQACFISFITTYNITIIGIASIMQGNSDTVSCRQRFGQRKHNKYKFPVVNYLHEDKQIELSSIDRYYEEYNTVFDDLISN